MHDFIRKNTNSEAGELLINILELLDNLNDSRYIIPIEQLLSDTSNYTNNEIISTIRVILDEITENQLLQAGIGLSETSLLGLKDKYYLLNALWMLTLIEDTSNLESLTEDSIDTKDVVLHAIEGFTDIDIGHLHNNIDSIDNKILDYIHELINNRDDLATVEDHGYIVERMNKLPDNLNAPLVNGYLTTLELGYDPDSLFALIKDDLNINSVAEVAHELIVLVSGSHLVENLQETIQSYTEKLELDIDTQSRINQLTARILDA